MQSVGLPAEGRQVAGASTAHVHVIITGEREGGRVNSRTLYERGRKEGRKRIFYKRA